MDIETILTKQLEELLNRLEVPYDSVNVKKDTDENPPMYRINIETEDPSVLIGFHGENIHALQHLLKVLAWEQKQEDFNILLDVDNYRKRQEENVINLAERKAEMARKTNKTQVLPPMSPYFRRLVHLQLAKPEYDDLSTKSIGDGNHRQVTILCVAS
jgi:spoIIIJ-associated protein